MDTRAGREEAFGLLAVLKLPGRFRGLEPSRVSFIELIFRQYEIDLPGEALIRILLIRNPVDEEELIGFDLIDIAALAIERDRGSLLAGRQSLPLHRL